MDYGANVLCGVPVYLSANAHISYVVSAKPNSTGYRGKFVWMTRPGWHSKFWVTQSWICCLLPQVNLQQNTRWH